MTQLKIEVVINKCNYKITSIKISNLTMLGMEIGMYD